MSGKYFYIRSQMNGLVLDVQGEGTYPGTKVITYNQKPGKAANQIFYYDPYTYTIRTKLNDMCLDISGDSLVINPYNPGSHNQRMMISGNRIQSQMNPNRVLDIAAHDNNPGARVCMWDYHGSSNQHWNLEYLPPSYFYIKSKLNNKVLDVEGNNQSPGARVIMYSQKHPPSANQLWYEDQQGIIRSKMNDFALDSSRGDICLMPGNPGSQWIICGQKIQDRYNPNQVLDIVGANAGDCASLCAYGYHNANNQHWTFQYL